MVRKIQIVVGATIVGRDGLLAIESIAQQSKSWRIAIDRIAVVFTAAALTHQSKSLWLESLIVGCTQ
jgi:hypothetical protein